MSEQRIQGGKDGKRIRIEETKIEKSRKRNRRHRRKGRKNRKKKQNRKLKQGKPPLRT